MALAVCVLHQHEATRLNVAHLSVARLVFNRTIQPDRKHRLWDRMPSNLAHARWDAGEADAGRLITGRNLERHGIGVHRPLRRRHFDFVEMRLAIRGGVDAQTLHCANSFWFAMPKRSMPTMKEAG